MAVCAPSPSSRLSRLLASPLCVARQSGCVRLSAPRFGLLRGGAASHRLVRNAPALSELFRSCAGLCRKVRRLGFSERSGGSKCVCESFSLCSTCSRSQFQPPPAEPSSPCPLALLSRRRAARLGGSLRRGPRRAPSPSRVSSWRLRKGKRPRRRLPLRLARRRLRC